MINIEITNGPHLQVDWRQSMNVQVAFEAAYNKVPKGSFTYALQYFGDKLGYLVTMINETYETFNTKDGSFFFWEFLLNGKIASTGIDNVILQDGDTATFDFLPYSSAIPEKSTVHEKHKIKS